MVNSGARDEDFKWLGTESNRRHADFQSAALTTELPSLKPFNLFGLVRASQSLCVLALASLCMPAPPISPGDNPWAVTAIAVQPLRLSHALLRNRIVSET